MTDTTDETDATDSNVPADPEDSTRTPARPDLAEAAVAETEVADLPEPQTLRDYMRLVYVRIRSGDSGVLPVVGASSSSRFSSKRSTPTFSPRGISSTC